MSVIKLTAHLVVSGYGSLLLASRQLRFQDVNVCDETILQPQSYMKRAMLGVSLKYRIWNEVTPERTELIIAHRTRKLKGQRPDHVYRPTWTFLGRYRVLAVQRQYEDTALPIERVFKYIIMNFLNFIPIFIAVKVKYLKTRLRAPWLFGMY